MTTISWDSYVAVNIKPNCNRVRVGNGLQQLRKKIIRNREIISGDIFFRNFYYNNARVRGGGSGSPREEFVVSQKFDRLKQAQLARSGDECENADSKHKAYYRRVAKRSSELCHHIAYCILGSSLKIGTVFHISFPKDTINFSFSTFTLQLYRLHKLRREFPVE